MPLHGEGPVLHDSGTPAAHMHVVAVYAHCLDAPEWPPWQGAAVKLLRTMAEFHQSAFQQ